jgi:hypothetical protein
MLTPEDEELRKAIAEADAAEAELRRMKEQLVPRDRVAALDQLLRAELRAVIARETARFTPAICMATSDDERRDILIQMSEAMAAGVERVKAEMLAQTKAWTLAGLEDRAKEDERL